jgi:hypothetical protein
MAKSNTVPGTKALEVTNNFFLVPDQFLLPFSLAPTKDLLKLKLTILDNFKQNLGM